jgi:pimeloyl-ACP methyl ester carboxylesterase
VQVAIIRPGPIVGDMVHPYIRRRRGREVVTYPHPSLEPILARTLGVPLFQEQLLRMAMVAAGFTGTEAEELRRAFGFKRSERRMAEIETKLRAGMARQGIEGRAADEIVHAITAFALYGFPESHAASFALLAYASAYLKVHYPATTNTFREHVIAWAKDVRRSVDYLETRQDIDRERLAYVGISWGAAMAPIYLAVEPRFKAGVLIVGGFYVQRAAPEVEAINFAPRVKIPVLMLNGRFDFFLPEEGTQIPFFRLLGTPEDQKKRVVYDTGHNIPRPDLIRESLDWLDRYLGTVR